MADFSARSTSIPETPNAVSAKAAPVDESNATLVNTAGAAFMQGLEIDQVRKGEQFRKEYEENLRLEMTPYISMDPNDPEAGKSTLGEQAPDEKDVLDFASRAEQAMQIGGVGRGSIAATRMEDFLRRKKASNPWYAKRYERIAGEVNSDYRQLLQTVNQIEAFQFEQLEKQIAGAAAGREKRIARMRSTEEKVGSSSYQVVGLPLHEMSEDQLDAYDALLMERNGLAVDLDRYKEIMTEERAQSGELRAAAKEGRSIAKDKLFWFEKRRGEAERNIGVSAYRTVASSFGQDLQVLVRNLKDGAVKPEEVRANFAEISMQVDQSVENLMAFDPQGNPTGVPAGVIKETQDKVRETMLAPVERLLASEPEAYKAALELATNSDRLTLTRELPLHVAIGTTFPSIASTPAFTNSLLRSTTDTEKALTIALDKEVGALGDQLLTRLEATQKATEGVVEGASPQNRAQVLGASVSLLSEINRPGSGLARDVATNPRSKTAFLNLIKNTARHYEGLSAIGRKQAFDRIMGGSGFLTALQSLPEAQRADAAEAALNILRLDLLEYGSRYAAYRESVVYNEDTGDFEPTAQNATLAEYAKGANERLDLARQLNAFSTKMDEDVFLEYVFKIEPPKEESETQK